MLSVAKPPVIFSPAPRAVIGVVQIATDLVMDIEGSLLVARLPGVEIRHTKIAFDAEEICADTYQRALDSGAIKTAVNSLHWPQKTLQRDDPYISIWGISCTSMSFILGEESIRSCFPDGARVTNMWIAVLHALRAVGAKKVAVLTPYIEEVSSKNEQLLREEGFEIVASMLLGLSRDVETSAVTPECIADCVERLAAHGDGDTVFIGCSAFRACMPGFISDLEARIGGKSAATSTQAFLWHTLRSAGVDDQLGGYGRLLQDA